MIRLLIVLVLLPFNALAVSCDHVRQELNSLIHSDEYSDMYVAYACENQVTTFVISYNLNVDIKTFEEYKDSLANNICILLSNQYNSTDDLGRRILRLIYKGGFVIVLKHPEALEDTVYRKTLEDCINIDQDTTG